jgi:hypothetical protein
VRSNPSRSWTCLVPENWGDNGGNDGGQRRGQRVDSDDLHDVGCEEV